MSQAQAAPVLELQSTSAQETIMHGRRLGALLGPGDVALLSAPFGAGKTHLAKGIAAAFGVPPNDVSSPSFVLVNQYDASAAYDRMPIFHVDLYRIETPDALETVGLDDLIGPHSLVIVEWAEHAGDVVPTEHLAIQIDVGEHDQRVLRLVAHGPRYVELINKLHQERNT